MTRTLGFRHGAASVLLIAGIAFVAACKTPFDARAPQSADQCASESTCKACISGDYCIWCDGACVPRDSLDVDVRSRPKACPAPKEFTASCQ